MNTEHLSYPPLFSSKLSALNLSSKHERKHLVKRINVERQSPELAKGEVVLSVEISSPSEETLALYSHEDVCVRSDEITLKQQRDLGCFYSVTGSHTKSDARSSSESQEQATAGHSFMDYLPQSLGILADRQTRLETHMATLSAKVEVMDSKLDQILLLLSGTGS